MARPLVAALRRPRPGLVLGALAATLLLSAMAGAPDVSDGRARRTAAPAAQGSAAAAAGLRPASRPNVVMVMADDMRADDLRFMPHVRKELVGTGLTFENSFSPYPLCCPARASFLTGRYAHNHHVFSHEDPYGFQSFDDRRTLATALRARGYRTGFVGKYLNGYGEQRSRVTGRSSFRYVPAGWTDWIGAVSRPPRSRYRSGGTYNYFHTIFNHDGRIDDTHAGEYQTSVLGRFARALVRKYHRRPDPFFLYLSAVAPHFGGPVELDDPAGVVGPRGGVARIATPARPDWVKGRFDATITRAPGFPADGGPAEADVSDKPRPISHLPEPNAAERAAVRDSTRQRAEALFVLDREVGRLVATLKRTGEYDDTVLMFTSDNGYFLGEHRVLQGKIKPHEPSLRVPFVMAGKGVPHGRRYDPVTTPGVTATIAELAGARMPFPLDGTSVLPSVAADRGWSAPVVTEGLEGSRVFHTAATLSTPGFHDARTTIGVRTARWKYVRYVDGDAELYDLDRDPAEMTNRYDDPAYATVRADLAAVWRDRKDCVGATCRAPLPPDLQRGPAELGRATRAQAATLTRLYGVPR